MRFGSVFSGIEAASVAWTPLGWSAAWLSEIDPFACAVLAHHYPEVANLGDMTRLAGWVRMGLIEAPDILCGGSPCQAFSVAGLRKSLSDARGNLTLEFVRLADAIDDMRDTPAIIKWENVPGVLSTPDNAFGCFLAGLAGEDDPLEPPGKKWGNAGLVIGPRRTVAWRVLDSQYFGVAQRRRRVFVVASARTGFDPAAVLFEFDGMRRDTAPSRETRQETTSSSAPRTASNGEQGVEAFGGNNTSGSIDVAAAVNANRGCHNPGDFEAGTLLVMPTMTAGSSTPAGHAARSGHCKDAYIVPVPIPFDTTQITSPTNGSNPQLGDPCHPLAAGAHPPAIVFRTAQTSANGCGVSTDGLTYTLDGANGQAVAHTLRGAGFDASEDGTGRGTPLVPVLDRSYQQPREGESSNDYWQRMRDHEQAHGISAEMLSGGQAWPSLEVAAVAFQSSQSGVRLSDTHATLDANNGPRRHNGALTGMRVRRLTPEECEALQAFPRGYTLIPYRGRPASECPDGPRYKALGNSWTTTPVRWIGERIARQIEC